VNAPTHQVRAWLSASTAEEREVIHHVDSVFGVLLAIVVFQSNLILTFIRDYAPEYLIISISSYALTLMLTVFLGLIGILRQSWSCKILAWYLTLFLLIWEVTALGLTSLQMEIHAESLGVPPSLIPAVALLLSSLLTSSLVCNAYERRLLLVAPKGDHIAKVRLCRKVALVTGASAFTVLLIRILFLS